MTHRDKPKVWASYEPPEPIQKYLRQHAEFDYNRTGELATPELIRENLSDICGLMVTLRDRVDAALIEEASDLKVISNFAVGVDNIDVKAASSRHIWVTNTPDVLTDATADLAWALLLAVARRIPGSDRLVRSGGYSGWRNDLMLGTELSGKTLGIWGAGRIGQAIARRAFGFNLRILYHSRSRKTDFEQKLRARYVDFQELFRQSDFLILAVPLTPETESRIGYPEFELMKPDAILVNIARGALIREDELVHVLRNRLIGGAGLDVYMDTTGIHRKLGDLENVVLTPHIGSATRETREKMAFLSAKSVVDALSGRQPENAVNSMQSARIWPAQAELMAV